MSYSQVSAVAGALYPCCVVVVVPVGVVYGVDDLFHSRSDLVQSLVAYSSPSQQLRPRLRTAHPAP